VTCKIRIDPIIERENPKVGVSSKNDLGLNNHKFNAGKAPRETVTGAVVHILPREVMLEDEVNTMTLIGKVYKFKAKVTNGNLSPPSEWFYERRNLLVNISQIISKVSLFMGGGRRGLELDISCLF
jgi:hypothetical protein